MLLKEALEQKVMDVRLLDKHLADGKISRKEYDDYISALTDDSDNLASVEELSGTPGLRSE